MHFAELRVLYQQPLFALISRSRAVHLEHWRGESVQRCSLLSIKTGGCSEDCAYCAQSAHYTTGVEREDLLPLERILSTAKQARAQGATRFCMGAAWRGVHDGTEKFERVLEILREVSQLGMEVCVTLGEIGDNEAAKLKAAGVTAYNHNIDTSPDLGSYRPRNKRGHRGRHVFAWGQPGAEFTTALRNSSACSKSCAKSANSAWKSALPSVKSAIMKRRNSRPPASPLTITTSIPRPISDPIDRETSAGTGGDTFLHGGSLARSSRRH